MDFNAALKEEEVVEEKFEVSPMSLEAVKPSFLPYLVRVREMADEAKAVDVSDDDSLKYAVSLGGDAKKIAKAIETQRKKVIQEPNDFVKAVNSFCKLFTEELAQAEAVLKKKISGYQYQQELERRKREEAARKAAAELQEKLRREAEEANRKAREEAARKAEEEARARAASEAEIAAAKKKAEEEAKAREVVAPVVQEPIVPKESNVTRSESGVAAYQRKTWTFEITDETQIPREYLKVDEGKIRDAIKMGARDIAGIRIYETSTTVFRS
jgi:DNA polymerase III alpha subunit (gram-positive type)